MPVGRRRTDPGPARRLREGEASGPLFRDQFQRRVDQGLFQVAVVVAARARPSALPGPAHVKSVYIDSMAASTGPPTCVQAAGGEERQMKSTAVSAIACNAAREAPARARRARVCSTADAITASAVGSAPRRNSPRSWANRILASNASSISRSPCANDVRIFASRIASVVAVLMAKHPLGPAFPDK